jgi:hypothetical protein
MNMPGLAGSTWFASAWMGTVAVELTAGGFGVWAANVRPVEEIMQVSTINIGSSRRVIKSSCGR